MLRASAPLFFVASVVALVACSSGSTGTTSGEGSGEGTGASDGPRGGEPTIGTPIDGTGSGGSSGETASGGSSSGQDPASSSGTSGASGTSGTGGTSGTSGSSGTTPPRAECVAWANRHCTCLENAGAASANCRTTTAKGCDDAVKICPAMLSWYVCSQTTCGNTCTRPSC